MCVLVTNQTAWHGTRQRNKVGACERPLKAEAKVEEADRANGGQPEKPSDVDIAGRQCIGFNKGAAWLDIITHERGEDLVGSNGVFDLDF